jgi:hypothetical protein
MDFHRSLEMSVSREEFFRLLPAAVGAFDVDGALVRGVDGERGWAIRLVPLVGRRFGNVAIPRHRVEITVKTCSEAEGKAFMDRFHRGFLRGGG